MRAKSRQNDDSMPVMEHQAHKARSCYMPRSSTARLQSKVCLWLQIDNNNKTAACSCTRDVKDGECGRMPRRMRKSSRKGFVEGCSASSGLRHKLLARLNLPDLQKPLAHQISALSCRTLCHGNLPGRDVRNLRTVKPHPSVPCAEKRLRGRRWLIAHWRNSCQVAHCSPVSPQKMMTTTRHQQMA